MQRESIFDQGTGESEFNAGQAKCNDGDIKTSFTIYGRLESLNEYIEKCRRNKYAGGAMKRRSQDHVLRAIDIEPVETPVYITYRFYEPNNKRDADNVASYGIKVIQDALVEAGIIPDDSRKHITGYAVEFYTDKTNPRIEVEIRSER